MSTTVTENVTRFNAENATSTAAAFLKRLGYRRGLRAIKVSLEGETYIVEMGMEKKTAKVQINYNTKEIKEYEIQDIEIESGFSLEGKKLPIIVLSLVAISAIALKLLGFF